jgi:hypothetical protein
MQSIRADDEAGARAAFRRANPAFDATAELDRLRARDYARFIESFADRPCP